MREAKSQARKGRRPRRRVPADQRRRELVDAAVRVISREGTARATTRLIADEANAPLASLHYSFASKDQLFAAVIEHCHRLTMERYRERADPSTDLQRAVESILELHYDMAVTDPDFMIAQYELLMWAIRTPGARGYAASIYDGYFQLFADVLSDVTDGPTDFAEIERLSRYIVAVTDGIIFQVIAEGDREATRDDIHDDIHGYVLGALAVSARGSTTQARKRSITGLA